MARSYFINSVALGYQSGPRWLFGNKGMKSLGKGSLCLQRALFGPRDSDKAMEIRFLWVIVAMFPKEGIRKLWCIPMMEYYAIRMNGLQIHATIRMNHTNITFSERNQIQKVHSLCIQLHTLQKSRQNPRSTKSGYGVPLVGGSDWKGGQG